MMKTMTRRKIQLIAISLLFGIVTYVFLQTSTGASFREWWHTPLGESPYVLFLFVVSALFFVLFAYLRWGTRSWYETSGKIVDRMNALKSKTSYPIIEYTDAHGQVQRGEANRIAFWYPSDMVRIRVTPKGNIHVKGVEWGAFFMAALFLTAAVIHLLV